MKYHYNDNELLYLIREKEDSALEIIYQKYTPMIKKRIGDFKIKYKNQDDFFQEGLITLKKAIETYKDEYGKTFNKYFDLLIQRRFIQLLKKESKYFYNVSVVEDVDTIVCLEEKKEVLTLNDVDTSNLSTFENQVMELIYIENMKALEVSEKLNCDIRKVYNAVSRAKNKIKNNI